MLEYMFLIIRNLNEIDEWFDNKDIKVNILRYFYMNIVKVCID